MSRYDGRGSADDLAYGDYNRWDRDRFDRSSRVPPAPPEPPGRFQEEIRITERERDRGGRRDVMVEERDRIYRETYGTGSRRRTDRELFGNVDPREIADMAVEPYKGDSREDKEKDLEITIRETRKERPGRPGMTRRQSSLDTFDRRPQPRYDREESRLPPNIPIPLPIRRKEGEDTYREVEIKRERSVHRRSGKKSRAPSIESSSSSSISTVMEQPKAPAFKKGKTRMPKRLVYKEAIVDLGYPFTEEERFYVLQIALEKEQIDEVIKISETYKASGKHDVFRYEERIDEVEGGAEDQRVGREEIIRKEYINPPSDFLRAEAPKRSRSSRRAHSPSVESSISQRTARTSRSRARSTVLPGPEYFEERRTVIGVPSQALTIQRVEQRSDNDIHAEIIRLEAERRALRLERSGGEDMQLAILREERPRGGRDRSESRSPVRNIIRVEKDRKGRMSLVRSAR